jgi:hypothetical protein
MSLQFHDPYSPDIQSFIPEIFINLAENMTFAAHCLKFHIKIKALFKCLFLIHSTRLSLSVWIKLRGHNFNRLLSRQSNPRRAIAKYSFRVWFSCFETIVCQERPSLKRFHSAENSHYDPPSAANLHTILFFTSAIPPVNFTSLLYRRAGR